MSSCPTCALPNHAESISCAFCGDKLIGPAPLLARVTVRGNTFSMMSADRVLATASRDSDYWRVEVGRGDFRMLPLLTDEGGVECVLIDESLHVVATVHSASNTHSETVLVRDAADEVVAKVRSDGNGGVQAIDTKGDLLFFGGTKGDRSEALDLFLTDGACALPVVIIFTLAIALQTSLAGLLDSRN